MWGEGRIWDVCGARGSPGSRNALDPLEAPGCRGFEGTGVRLLWVSTEMAGRLGGAARTGSLQRGKGRVWGEEAGSPGPISGYGLKLERRWRALGAVRSDTGLWAVPRQSQPCTCPQSSREWKEGRAVHLLGAWVLRQACGSRR